MKPTRSPPRSSQRLAEADGLAELKLLRNFKMASCAVAMPVDCTIKSESCISRSLASRRSSEKHDVALLNNVVFALDPQLAEVLGCLFAARLFQVIESGVSHMTAGEERQDAL